jgi:hypothetical protein
MKGLSCRPDAFLVIVACVFAMACGRAPQTGQGQAISAVPGSQVTAQKIQTPVSPQSPAVPPGSVGVAAPTGAPSVQDGTAKTHAPPPKVTDTEKSQTLLIAQQEFRFVTHTKSIQSTATQPADETVEWWELRDATDKVLYRESYSVAFQNGTFDNTTNVNASSFTTSQGSGIIVSGLDLPSAPDSGGWLRLFAFKYGPQKYGTDERLFVPFGPPISIEGEFLGLGVDSFTPAPIMGSTPPTVTRDVLKFRTWTGNFNIVYPVQIDWIAGKLEPAWHCLESTSKGQVERCSYPVMVEPHRDSQPTFVRLFAEPDEGLTAKHLIVQPQSKIEYLEARMPVAWNDNSKTIDFGANGDVWLKVRIDGQEGWIHTEEDFEAVGLPTAG